MRGPAELLAYRDEFPAVQRSVFLGSHTLAPLSRRARAAVTRFLDVWETEASAELVWFDHVLPEMRRLEASYARLIDADADEVALTASVSAGLASIASSFRFDVRDEVVISREEFPTDCLVWLAQERNGARVTWVDGRDEQAYAAAISDRTMVVNASRVSFLDGALLDPAALARACHAAGALLVLDDFHGSGVVPLDVHAAEVDLLVSGPLKYLFGGPGVAFVYVRRDLASTLEPSVTGWFAQRDFFAFDGSRIDRPDNAQRMTAGTPAPAAIFAAAAGLEIVHEVGVDTIRARVLELTDHVIARADELGYAVRTPREHARRGGLVAIEVADAPSVLERLLRSERVVVDQRRGALRLSPHFFSSEDDVDAFFAALARVAPRPA